MYERVALWASTQGFNICLGPAIALVVVAGEIVRASTLIRKRFQDVGPLCLLDPDQSNFACTNAAYDEPSQSSQPTQCSEDTGSKSVSGAQPQSPYVHGMRPVQLLDVIGISKLFELQGAEPSSTPTALEAPPLHVRPRADKHACTPMCVHLQQ